MADCLQSLLRGDEGIRLMVWTSNQPRRRVFPYCVIREAENGGRKRFELVITYGADLRSVERFTNVADARRRAEEWFHISHRPLVFTSRRLEAYIARPFTLRHGWDALVVRPLDALGTWLFGREADGLAAVNAPGEVREGFREELR